MLVLKIFDLLLIGLFLSWIGWLIFYNPGVLDAYDMLLGGFTLFGIVSGTIDRKKIISSAENLQIIGSTWRLVFNAVALPLAGYFLYYKIPMDDISARLILWLFYLTFVYDICLRLKAWRILSHNASAQ